MAPLRKISTLQLELLVDFAEQNPIIVNNSCRSGPLAHRQTIKAWDNLSRVLNACGDGEIKTPDQWKRYWHLLKCRTKGKAARLKQSATEGGSNTLAPLTDQEERIMCVCETSAVKQSFPVVTPVNATEVRIPVKPKSYPTNRDENMPRWAYRLKSRSIVAKERIADAMEGMTSSLQQLAESQAELVRQQSQLVELQTRLLETLPERILLLPS